MLPGRLSTDLPWLWFIGAFLLGAVLVHDVASADCSLELSFSETF
jgi:hypothetical protein